MRLTSRIITTVAVGLLLSIAASASATVMRKLRLEQLVGGADLIVRAHVTSQRSAWSADQTAIQTFTEIRIDERLKGRASGTTLTVRQIGGAVGDRAMRVAGSGELRVGQEAVLFLRTEDAQWFLTDLAQSVYYVSRSGGEATAQRNLEGIAFALDRNATRLEHAGPEAPVTLSRLLSDIRSLARRTQ